MRGSCSCRANSTRRLHTRFGRGFHSITFQSLPRNGSCSTLWAHLPGTPTELPMVRWRSCDEPDGLMSRWPKRSTMEHCSTCSFAWRMPSTSILRPVLTPMAVHRCSTEHVTSASTSGERPLPRRVVCADQLAARLRSPRLDPTVAHPVTGANHPREDACQSQTGARRTGASHECRLARTPGQPLPRLGEDPPIPVSRTSKWTLGREGAPGWRPGARDVLLGLGATHLTRAPESQFRHTQCRVMTTYAAPPRPVGSVTTKRVPPSCGNSAVMQPPCSSTICRLMYSPSPIPAAYVPAASAW